MGLGHAVLLLVHLLAFAALVGGCAVQARSPRPEVNAPMLYGALLAFASGVALFAVDDGAPPNFYKGGLKAGLLVVVIVLCWANRRFEYMPRGVFWIIFGLALADTGVAVLWR